VFDALATSIADKAAEITTGKTPPSTPQNLRRLENFA
jgi:hypothetical protein